MKNEDMPLDLPPEYRKSSTEYSGSFPGLWMRTVILGGRTVCRIYNDGKVRPYPGPSKYGMGCDLERGVYTKFPDYAAARAWVEMMCNLNAWEYQGDD